MGLLTAKLLFLLAVPACQERGCAGRWISSDLGILSFCVPPGMRVEEAVGEHGDVHYEVRWRGQVMRMTSGLWFSAKRAEEFDGSWSVRSWTSPHGERREYRREVEGKRSRYVTLAPSGWVEYTDVPAAQAKAFDAVLESFCWRPLAKP